jgi:hypothetical protein
MASIWTIFLSVAIVAVVSYWNSRTKIPKGLKAVPGPKPLPVIGNALELSDYPEKKFMEWAREYGELFQVQLGWNNWVFVCSDQAVKVKSPGFVIDGRKFWTNKRRKHPLVHHSLLRRISYQEVVVSSS